MAINATVKSERQVGDVSVEVGRLRIGSLKLLPNYGKAFGLATGARLFSKIHLQKRRRGALFSVSLGNQSAWLRSTPSDIAIFDQIMVKLDYETAHWPLHHKHLREAYSRILAADRTPIIIDAGANIGLASLWFAREYPEARIFTIEPDDDNLAVLDRNLGHLPNVTVLPGAIWDQPAKLQIGNPGAGAGAFRVVEGQGDLRAYSVAEILTMEPDGSLFIAKIDIEGGESALFRSNTEWAAEASLIIIEPHDWLYPMEGTSRNFLRALAGLPFDFVFRGENVFFFHHGASR
jgi:FkbM family methyltransferase